MAVVALGEVFQRFVEKSPISVMAGGLVERLLSPDRLNELFERSAIDQYTRELLFSTMFDLMSEVVMGARRSVHAAYQASREEISVSIASVYNKLDGIETEVSAALVRETGREVAAVIEEMGGKVPALLAGYRVKILDGNAIAATEHRIRELRADSAGPLPGKSLVVLDPQMRAAIDVFPCEDGHAQERSLLGEVLKRIESRDVWIADRNFCTLGFLFSIARLGAYFVIRQHGQMPWEAVGTRRTLLESIGLVKTGADMLLFGLPDGKEPVPFNFHDFFRKRVRATATYGAQLEPGLVSFQAAVDLIVRKQIDVSPLVSHVLPIEEVERAIHLAHERTDNAIKVSLRMQ